MSYTPDMIGGMLVGMFTVTFADLSVGVAYALTSVVFGAMASALIDTL